MHDFFVRVGALAEVHLARGPAPLPRGRRVLVRTSRGVELGEVIGPSKPIHHVVPPTRQSRRRGSDEHTAPTNRPPDRPPLAIIRPTTSEDELLIRRLERHKREAVEACRNALRQSGSEAILLDVDQLFDGGTLILHFLGPVDPIAESITKQVADRYESIVRTRHFSKLLREGCGPGCGTEQGGGCGSNCAGCAVACHAR